MAWKRSQKLLQNLHVKISSNIQLVSPPIDVNGPAPITRRHMCKMTNHDNSLSYKQAGVDIDAGNALVEAIKPAVRSTRRPGADGEIGGFGGLFDLKAIGMKDPILVAANDGVGTKLKIAIETGIHHSVGIDLVAMCVNDLVVQGAEPLFFLDYFATGKLEVDAATQVIEGIANGCRQANCALIGGETAEMPGMYADKDYDLAGFSLGAVERDALLPRPDIAAGDVIIGMPSSGVHSNGFSLVRKIVELSGLAWEDPAPFAPDQTLAQALLTPTKIYVRALISALRADIAIKGLVHITGGGFTENIPRILGDDLAAHINLDTIDCLPVFGWLAGLGGIKASEMVRTFNCGIGMIVIVPPEQAGAALEHFQAQGEPCVIIGQIETRESDAVIYEGELSL